MSIQFTKLAVAGLTLLSTPSDVRSLVYTGASKVFDGNLVAMTGYDVCGDIGGRNIGSVVGVVQHQHAGKSGRSDDTTEAVDVYINNDCLPVKIQGRIWVKPVGPVVSFGKSSKVYAYSAGPNLGKLTANANAVDTVVLNGAWWDTESTPDGFAIVMLDNPITVDNPQL